MIALDQLEEKIKNKNSASIPPVDKWNPPLSGDIDICIKANGDWYHEGIKFTRQSLVKLFSSILKKEGSDYFLVTPAEKWRIKVDDKPLLVVDYKIEKPDIDGVSQKILFYTSTDDIFYLDKSHLIRLETSNSNHERKPYVVVRKNLDALIHRNVFYRLADLAIEHNGVFGLWSCGAFFNLD